MTERERFTAALERRPITGRVPHFELVFFLTMEAIGKVHPEHRRFEQWKQMTETERELLRRDQADCYIQIAEKYHHSAILVHAPGKGFEEQIKFYNIIREKINDKYFIIMQRDPTFKIPSGENMIEFSVACAEESENVKKRAQESVDRYLHDVEMLAKYPGLVDGVAMCSDYCFNTNPFFSPEMFSEFVAPYLEQAVRANRELGFYTIKHTDGNIMPILDQIVQCRPDAIHSLDPQAGVRLGEVKRMIGDKVCLIGNVNCGLLQTGTDEEVIADVRRALREGMPGYGYIFSTSNCVYTGMRLSRYELMNKIWYEEGIY